MSSQDYNWLEVWEGDMYRLASDFKEIRDEIWCIESDVTDTLDSIMDEYEEEGEINYSKKHILDIYRDDAIEVAQIDSLDSKIEDAMDHQIEKLPDKVPEERKNVVGGHKRLEIDELRNQILEYYEEAWHYRRQIKESLNEIIIPSVKMVEKDLLEDTN